MRFVAIGIALAWLSTNVASAAEPPSETLSIAQGTLAGTREDGIASFKHIPFAAPPVGLLRWRAPQAAPSWQGVRVADKFGFSPARNNDCLCCSASSRRVCPRARTAFRSTSGRPTATPGFR